MKESLQHSRLPAVPDVHHIAVLHHVFFAFKAQRALGARRRLRAGFQQIVPANGFGADEVMLQVGVNRARRLRRLRAQPAPSTRGTRLRPR